MPKAQSKNKKPVNEPAGQDPVHSAEASFELIKPRLVALDESTVRIPNIDVQQAAAAALGVDGLLRAAETRPKVEALGAAKLASGELLDGLADVARAAWYARYRLLQVSATHSEATLPVSLVEEAFVLRARMLKTLEYNLDDDASAMGRLTAIRAGSGHIDLGNDLLGAADLYREYEATLAQDKKNYRPSDEAEARKLSARILTLLGAVTTPEQTLWKGHQARAFTLLLTHYEEARRVGRFLFHYADGERLFPSLFSKVRSAPGARGKGGEEGTGSEVGSGEAAQG
ncbi:hypothetical protein [Polyangium fumosum]|uniref:Uncharacterized protein n=1 Tax=Polyangium fumosum TaxID=889272 RepID=A0A4U1J635_9BACT|nr:hypothetical protein [Polyangium fumosum]TKD02245.1 hypothetical protein E8A74_29160 [Polyangium fumosum]